MAFIGHNLEQGVQLVWSCWPINTSSVQMAQKPGFVARTDVPVLYARLDPRT